jgi:hypothetical protein
VPKRRTHGGVLAINQWKLKPTVHSLFHKSFETGKIPFDGQLPRSFQKPVSVLPNGRSESTSDNFQCTKCPFRPFAERPKLRADFLNLPDRASAAPPAQVARTCKFVRHGCCALTGKGSGASAPMPGADGVARCVFSRRKPCSEVGSDWERGALMCSWSKAAWWHASGAGSSCKHATILKANLKQRGGAPVPITARVVQASWQQPNQLQWWAPLAASA